MSRNRSIKRFAVLVVGVIWVASLVGCLPGAQAPTTQPVPPAETDIPQEIPSIEPVSPTEPAAPEVERSRIVIVIPEAPSAFNGTVSDTGYNQLVMELVMLGMADIDPEGKVFPELAAELPTAENGGVVVDEENGTMDVTWKMRPDIVWADGEPVTADDVVFTWNAITDPEGGIWIEGLDYTDGVEKIDDNTFVVHYNSIYPAYLTQFGGENMVIFPEHYCDASQGFVAWNCNLEPLSNGPYLLEEWVTGDHLTFVRNPNYFEEGKPAIDTIIVQIVPEKSVEKTMLLQGDADLIMWATEDMVADLMESSDVKVSFSPTNRWVMRLYPNLAARGTTDPAASPHPILADVRVREAIQMAIDVDMIGEEIWHGYPEPIWTEFFRPPYVCEMPRPAYDPQAAAALLEEAGWQDQDGDGVRECHGCTNAEEGYRMSMQFMTYSEYGEELELTQQLIAEMLKNIGIELELSLTEGAIMWADFASGGLEQTGNFDLNMWDDGYPGIDPTDFLWYMYHTDAAQPDNGWNVARWSNEEFDALMDEAYTLDEGARQEIFCKMAQILADELPNIPLFSTLNADAHSARLLGVQSTINDIVTWNVANWTLAK